MENAEMKNEEEVQDISIRVVSLEYPGDMRSWLLVFNNEMFPVFSVHIVDFRLLVDYQQFEHGQSIAKILFSVLSNSPLNVRLVHNDHNSSHEQLFTN